jgi:hypothetical protein
VTTLNIGDGGLVTQHHKTKRIRVKGFWKFKPFSPCKDEITSKILNEIIEKEISDGLRQREERIVPCTQEEAQLVGTNHKFFDVKDVELDASAPQVNVESYEKEHNHQLAVMKRDGEMGLYGHIKLPVTEYSRFFDCEGKLRRE